MTNKNKTKFSPLFPNKPPVQQDSIETPTILNSGKSVVSGMNHRYQTGDASTILFLSKRGMSRSPLAREVLREKSASLPTSECVGYPLGESLRRMINVLLMATCVHLRINSDMFFKVIQDFPPYPILHRQT